MAHAWSKNCKTTIPNQNIFFDTETWAMPLDQNKTIMPFRLGYAIYRTHHGENKTDKRIVHYIPNAEDFFQFVQSCIHSKERLCLWAHNIAFDLATTYFYYYAFKAGWRSRIPYTKGGIFIDSLVKGDMKIDILDTYNHFKCSLKALGNSFNLPKGDIVFNDKYIPKRLLKPYCLRDVEIIETAIFSYYDFLKHDDLGNAQKTIASQAFGTYRHRFMPKKVWPQTKGQPFELERKSYKGGRVECFEIGKVNQNVYKLDVNSMYPYVMNTEKYPHAFSFVFKQMSLTKLKALLKKYLITAECYINTDEPAYGKKINGKLCFPVGEFWVCLSTPEIEYALKHNHLVKVGQVEGHKGHMIFKEYVDFMYNKRLEYKKEGNKPYTLFVKYLLNSLYGKTGQKERITEETDIADIMKIEEKLMFKFIKGIRIPITNISFGGRQIERTTTDKESYNSYCAIASHVTAHARIYLYKLIKQAGIENCFYCDTDSIFTNAIGYTNLKRYLSDTKLGGLKLEETTNHLIIKGNKDYIFGDKITLKGVKGNSIQISANEYKYEQWSTFHDIFKTGLLYPPSRTWTTKILKRKYDKGEIKINGRVDPFILNEPLTLG